MTFVLAGLTLALLAALVFTVVNSRRERETMMKAVSLAITEGTKERDAARLERQELANRIQRPEATPVYDMPEGESQGLPFESDEAFWAYKSGLDGNN